MKTQSFDIDGPLLLTPKRHIDERGVFSETFNLDRFRDATSSSTAFMQDNESLSLKTGTIRGLHYQAPPFEQGKLVRCVSGKIIDIAVDVRTGSKTYGQHVRVELSASNGAQLWVPAGFLHGFSTLTDHTIVNYKVTNPYAPQSEGCVRFDDPILGLDWGLSTHPLISEKDARATEFLDWTSPFQMET